MTKVSINKNKTKELKMNKAKMKPVEIKVIPGGRKDKDLEHKYHRARCALRTNCEANEA